MSEDDTEQIDLEDADLDFTWEEAVTRAQTLYYCRRSFPAKTRQARIESRYPIRRAQSRKIRRRNEIPFETLKRYRSVWRSWEKEGEHPARYSVARALARIPDKLRVFNRLIEKGEGAVTEEAAIEAAKEYREERSSGKYDDFPLHKIVNLICRKLNCVAREDSELAHALNDFLKYEEVDFEYFRKIADAIDEATQRLSALRQKVSNGMFSDLVPAEAEAEAEPAEPEAEPAEPAEPENLGTAVIPFRKGEED